MNLSLEFKTLLENLMAITFNLPIIGLDTPEIEEYLGDDILMLDQIHAKYEHFSQGFSNISEPLGGSIVHDHIASEMKLVNHLATTDTSSKEKLVKIFELASVIFESLKMIDSLKLMFEIMKESSEFKAKLINALP